MQDWVDQMWGAGQTLFGVSGLVVRPCLYGFAPAAGTSRTSLFHAHRGGMSALIGRRRVAAVMRSFMEKRQLTTRK
jgi:hypothetical protein